MNVFFEDGRLRDITRGVGDQPDTLFRDRFGDAGPMLIQVRAQYWPETLYNLPLRDIAAVLDVVRAANTRFD